MSIRSLTTTIGAITLISTMTTASFGQEDLSRMKGRVRIDGSSTVYPITEAVAEEFAEVAPRIRVTVGISGTGGGFKRFTTGEIDISDASRPIKKKELDASVKHGIDFIELPIAYDGLSIVVNNNNDWVDSLSVDDLKKIFLYGSPVKTWKDIRSDWPDVPVSIYAPGTDSGTFDYFKEIVAGKTGSIRSDMSVSEDDNVLVRGVSGDAGGIGFFGCAYYFENKDKLKVVPIVNPKTDEAITPNAKTIENGSYAPFSRPLFIYVNKKSADRPEVQAFVEFYLKEGPKLAQEVGYVQLPKVLQKRVAANYASRKTGTQFLDKKGEKVTGPVTEVYK